MEYLEEYADHVKDLTIAERIKFITAYEWAGNQKPTPEQAVEKAKSKCSSDKVADRHAPGNLSFESELGAIEMIKKIAQLSDEEAKRFEEDVFTKSSVSPDIAQKVKTAFETLGTEAKVIESLVSIHDNWVRNHGDNFQKITTNKEGNQEKRDKDYQFVDLRLMSFDKDGARADLIFIQPILESCGIYIDMSKLQDAFEQAQKSFLDEKNIHTHEDLLRHVEQGSATYSPLSGLKAFDGNLIDDHLNGSTGIMTTEKNGEITSVSAHMAKQVESRSGIDFSRFTAKNFEEYQLEGIGIEDDIRKMQERTQEPEKDSQLNEDQQID